MIGIFETKGNVNLLTHDLVYVTKGESDSSYIVTIIESNLLNDSYSIYDRHVTLDAGFIDWEAVEKSSDFDLDFDKLEKEKLAYILHCYYVGMDVFYDEIIDFNTLDELRDSLIARGLAGVI